MQKFVSFLIRFALLVLGLILGFAIGSDKGYDKGYQIGYDKVKNEYKLRPVEEIRSELATREIETISDYLDATATVEKKDEGGLFTVKYVQYLTGTLTNSATLVSAWDIKLKIIYLSKTGSEIGSQEIIIYELVKPRQTINFRGKINVPEQMAVTKFQVLEAKSDI